MLALFHATQATIKKTAAHGIALVSVTDAWMSGRGAYYVEMIAKHGFVAIHTAASARLVAPPGGIRPVLGTNPIAIAVPSSRGPIVLDMGTSADRGDATRTAWRVTSRRRRTRPRGRAD
jgi:L-2-hydroxycarboxylate dehydrogenase (NAD+)